VIESDVEMNDKSVDIKRFKSLARKVRLSVLDMMRRTKSPHIGPSFSIVEILVALYFKILNISPTNPRDSKRDKFILSKGHACPALYAVLKERGFLRNRQLKKFAVDGGCLQHHPEYDLGCGIELSTGSLGHGLSVGGGMALAGKGKRKGAKTFVLLGDGELNEGAVWEAALFAGHHKLNNLIAIIDHNKMQALGHMKDIIDLDPLKEKWMAFGWHAQEINGHDFGQIFKAFDSLSSSKPNAIILHTVKGKGVSFMENDLLWHYRYPHEGDEYEKALKELAE